MKSWLKLDYKGIYAGIISISMMGIVLFKIIDLIERKACRWKTYNYNI